MQVLDKGPQVARTAVRIWNLASCPLAAISVDTRNGALWATRVATSGSTLQIGPTMTLFAPPVAPTMNDDRRFLVTRDGPHFLFKTGIENDPPSVIRVITPAPTAAT